MSTREVEEIIRQSYVDELDTVAVPAALLSRVTSMPDVAPTRPATDVRRFMLIAAVAVLSTAALGLALAVGGGLPRPPVTADATQSPVPTNAQTPGPTAVQAAGTLSAADEPLGGYCGVPLPDGLILQFVTHADAGLDKQSMVIVLDDGTVLIGDRESLRFGAGIRSRRLTEAGLTALAEMVSNAGLLRCLSLPDGPGKRGWLTARTGNGDFAMWYGQGRATAVDKASEGEQQALYQLAEQLQDLDASIPPFGWIDGSWQQYLPNQWRLFVTLRAMSEETCRLGGEPTSSPMPNECLAWASDIVLPDGTPLLSFGMLYPGPYRCGIVEQTAAEEIANALKLLPDYDGIMDRFWSAGGGADFESVHLSLTALVPGDDDCEPSALVAEPPGSAPEDVLTAVDPCAVIRGGIEDKYYMQDDAYTIGGPGWWTGCWSEIPNTFGFPYRIGEFHVYARGERTSAADGDAYASSLFGDGIESEQLAGRTIFWNSCFGSYRGCTAAAAVVSEPHLVVFTWLGNPTKEDLRAIIARVVERQLIP